MTTKKSLVTNRDGFSAPGRVTSNGAPGTHGEMTACWVAWSHLYGNSRVEEKVHIKLSSIWDAVRLALCRDVCGSSSQRRREGQMTLTIAARMAALIKIMVM